MSLLATPSDGGSATRVDREAGIREVAEFFGPGRSKIFGFTHLPLDRSVGGVVICSPLQAEFVRNYRREVLLGRALAARGFAVQRFHYRGFGHSDGESNDATFDSMREDALAAANRLLEYSGVTNVALMGTRWGSLVAGAAARNFVGAPLILWEPVVDASRFFREVFRWRLVHDLKEGIPSGRSGEALIAELRDIGSVDILGYSIDLALYESGAGRNLTQIVEEEPRSILLIQLNRNHALRREYADIVSRWRENGFNVETQAIPHDEPWWFGGGGGNLKQVLDLGNTMVDLTVAWLLREMSG